MVNRERSYSWGDHRPFNSLVRLFREKYGGRIQKVSVNAGFTCPNRDGEITYGGCIYCNNESFTPSYCNADESVYQQIESGIEFMNFRYRKANRFLAYFQSFSNTYAPLSKLKSLYEEALSHPKIHGLAISTRPDCLNNSIIDYLSQLSKSKIILVEIGIESCYDDTLLKINRGHSFAKTMNAFEMLSGRGLHVGGHLMFGLPGESKDQMLEEVNIISGLPLDSIKFHQLQIIKNTKMQKYYLDNKNEFDLFEKDEYIDFIVSFIERLNPAIAIERFVSEVPPRYKIAPDWGLIRSDILIQQIEKRFFELDTWQGKLYNNKEATGKLR